MSLWQHNCDVVPMANTLMVLSLPFEIFTNWQVNSHETLPLIFSDRRMRADLCAFLVLHLVMARLKGYYVGAYNPLPLYLSTTVAWPVCYLSGGMLIVLLAKGRIELPRALRLTLGVVGGACFSLFVFTMLAVFVVNLPSLEGAARHLYSLYGLLIATPALIFPPCVLLGAALVSVDKKGPDFSQQSATDSASEDPASKPTPPATSN